MYIDTHCHLDFDPLSTDTPGVLERAHGAGVTRIINVGTSLHRSREVVDIAKKYPNVWASVGMHPHEAETIHSIEDTIKNLKNIAKSDKVVAIGEIGLDYSSVTSDKRQVTSEIKEKQKELFLAQLKLAQELKLPVIIHVRDAWEDTLEIISNFKFQISNSDSVGVVHCFTGDAKIAKKLIELGFYIGFTGLITFKNPSVDSIKNVAKIIPLEKILIETDAPLLTPEPHRGKPNEPAYVVEIAKKIAEIKGTSIAEVANQTTKNAEDLLKLN